MNKSKISNRNTRSAIHSGIIKNSSLGTKNKTQTNTDSDMIDENDLANLNNGEELNDLIFIDNNHEQYNHELFKYFKRKYEKDDEITINLRSQIQKENQKQQIDEENFILERIKNLEAWEKQNIRVNQQEYNKFKKDKDISNLYGEIKRDLVNVKKLNLPILTEFSKKVDYEKDSIMLQNIKMSKRKFNFDVFFKDYTKQFKKEAVLKVLKNCHNGNPKEKEKICLAVLNAMAININILQRNNLLENQNLKHLNRKESNINTIKVSFIDLEKYDDIINKQQLIESQSKFFLFR